MSEICKRKLSVYDNVDLNESFEAAKRLVACEEASKNFPPSFAPDNVLNEDPPYDATSSQFNDDQQASSKDAITRQPSAGSAASKQLNGQPTNTQNGTGTNGNQNSQQQPVNSNGYAANDRPADQLERQNKKTSSFREKFLRRKSSIPTLKRNDSQRKARPSSELIKSTLPADTPLAQSPEPSHGPTDFRADRISDCSLDGPLNSFDHIDYRSQKLIKSPSSSSSNKTSTPIGKSSQIPRLNSSMGARLVLNSESPSQAASTGSKLRAPASSIPTNLASPIKSNLSTSHCDEAPRPIKIYVPYAEISSRNNSKSNSLASSTNSINNGANGLRMKKDDQNKITISVNQKYETSISGKSNLPKSYLPTIDT